MITRALQYRHVTILSIRVEIRARAQFFDPIFEGNFGGLLVLKMGYAAYRWKAPDVYFPNKISLQGSEFGGKRYGSQNSGRLSYFFVLFRLRFRSIGGCYRLTESSTS